MSDATAFHMACKAAYLFKRYYGDYPTRIGLDRLTRFREYVATHGVYLTIIEPDPLERLRQPLLVQEVSDDLLPQEVYYKRTLISIDMLLFIDPIAHALDGTHVPMAKPDAVWCQWEDSEPVKMSLWFSENGYDAIIWDSKEPA